MHRIRLLVGLTATALVVTGWTSTAAIAAGATEVPLPDVPALTSIDDVAALATSTQDDPGVRVAVVTDANGSAAGGVAVTTVQSDPAEVGALRNELDAVPGVLSTEVDSRVSAIEDPYVSQQYSANRIRENLVTNVASGDGVVVAVIDTGVLGTHPDLATQLPGGRQRVLTGTTFLTPDPGAADQTGTPGNVDPNGHGTHVGGIIAAAKGNGIGVAGLAPDAQILPVRALDSKGFGWSSDVATAILWAHQQGADVINLSLAGPTESPAVSTAIDQVTTDTSRGKAPTIVVAGAGNSAATYPRMWPAAHPRVIAVAATDGLDGVASFSSRGSYVDVAAPGMLILSTCTPATYCYRSGTSMASPAVAAVAALLREQDHTRSGSTVESILESTAFDADAIGQDVATGWGRIDAAAALDPAHYSKVPRPVRLPTGTFDSLVVDGRFMVVRGRANDPDGTPIVRVESSVDGKRTVRDMWAVGDAFAMGWNDVPGDHHVCVSALDTPTRRAVALGCRDVVVK
mgnify:CR=1 FL=1